VLEAVGLEPAVEEAYRLLLGQGELSATELGSLQGTSTPSAYGRLELLVAAGLATPTDDVPPVFRAIDPRTGLSALIRSRQAALDRASSVIDTFAEEYRERMLRSEEHRLVEVLDGRVTINQHLAELMAGAEREVLAFDTPPYVTPTPHTSLVEQDLLARGVSVRAVYASEVIAVETLAATIDQITRLGEQARVVPRVPLKMVVVDARAAVIPLSTSEEGTRSTAIVVHQSRLCDALIELFEATWAQGTPIFATAARQSGGLDPVDSALLSLLNAGLKDEAAARQLELSERTVRRRVADLVERLGATSRFQAGAQAVRRGWIS
jgi:sugar-specific transcriptional regulator TrmB/DNA-binding CsgD family transcriptional regulator